jgi:hypothetical protein
MRYRTFGRSGLRVSELFLGTMTFGESWGWGAPVEECRKMLDSRRGPRICKQAAMKIIGAKLAPGWRAAR